MITLIIAMAMVYSVTASQFYGRGPYERAMLIPRYPQREGASQGHGHWTVNKVTSYICCKQQ